MSSTPVKTPPPPPPHSSPLQAVQSPERETPRKIIARSKEILTVNLAIQVVKDEVKCLQDKARGMEEALHRRRLEMEQEAEALDSRLNESDDVAAAAVKEAEKMAKLRLQKTQELQELKRELQVVEKCLVELPRDGAVADATAGGEEIS
jgi:predicted  nucleic acid-binding Zn-ribbon protein